MTKAKKKITKSTFAIIIMAIAMVAMLAFGGTFAYFTASTSAQTKNITTGKVQLTNTTEATVMADASDVMPGTTIFAANSITFSTAGSTEDTYVAIKVEITIDGTKKTPDELVDAGFSFAASSEWTAVTDGNATVYVYNSNDFKAAKDTTLKFNDADIKFNANENNEDASDSLTYMGKTIVITFTGYSLQTSNVTIATVNAANVWAAISGNYDTNTTI